MESFAAWYRKYLVHTDRMRRAWLLWQSHGDDGEFLDGEGDMLDEHNHLIRVSHHSILDFASAKLPPTEQPPDGALVGVKYGNNGEIFWLHEASAPRYFGLAGRVGVKLVDRTLLVLDSFTAARHALHIPVGPPRRLVICTSGGLLVVHI